MDDEFDPFIAEWRVFVDSPTYNLVEKSLKFAQIIEYPDLDVEHYIAKIRKIGLSLKESIDVSITNPVYQISMLNEHLFTNLGFEGDENDYYDPRNNFLNEVIDRKRGLPITMSILYAEIAKFIGLDLKIVGFPSHVLAKYNEEIIIDPFYGGVRLEADDLQEILDVTYDEQIDMQPEFLDELSVEESLVRMARNLKNSYTHSFVYDKALRCTNMILAIEPESSEDIRDKGVIHERMLNHDVALKYLEMYLDMRPNANDVDRILELINSIRTRNSAINT